MDNVFALYLCVEGSNSVVLLLLSDVTCKERLSVFRLYVHVCTAVETLCKTYDHASDGCC